MKNAVVVESVNASLSMCEFETESENLRRQDMIPINGKFYCIRGCMDQQSSVVFQGLLKAFEITPVRRGRTYIFSNWPCNPISCKFPRQILVF